jgi:hypothetical protein
MHVLESYFSRLQEIRSTERGTPELSYRAALENLLNAVGSLLDPAVKATAELADTGAGRPDFGLFDARSRDLRGAVEVKPLADDVPQTADGRQVARYWKHYGCVLVTNYRDFLLVVKEPGDKMPRVEGRYRLAADEAAFWHCKPHALAKQHGEGLLDFLAGAMTRSSPITRPADLAAELARHAREATWGFFGAKNAVMCGKGRTAPSAADPTGGLDIFINDRVYWQNVPLDVWAMTIGGYPVIKKWLSYREFRVLGRPLLQDEMTYITEVVRRLKALLLMGESLDANYREAAAGAMEVSK